MSKIMHQDWEVKNGSMCGGTGVGLERVTVKEGRQVPNRGFGRTRLKIRRLVGNETRKGLKERPLNCGEWLVSKEQSRQVGGQRRQKKGKFVCNGQDWGQEREGEQGETGHGEMDSKGFLDLG